MAKLSKAAESALVDTPSSRQGTRVHASREVFTELAVAELVGQGWGLTRKGSIEAERIKSRRLEEAFG